jgi:peptidoglycan/LPS O-acetylase OafA/YrhL
MSVIDQDVSPSGTPADADYRTTRVHRMQHHPALDGLRGVAVLAVLLFHGDHLRGGYLGVDMFFVLSGFLITMLLLIEVDNAGAVSLRNFWVRRARRLLPALVCVLAAVALYAAFVASPESLGDIRGDAVATLLYVANWHEIFSDQDYFALFRSPSPLQHTWSLAIEEQFYLLFPLLFVFLVRMRRGTLAQRTLRTACVLAVASFVWAQVLYSSSNMARVYYGTDTRIFTILIGVALAAYLFSRNSSAAPLSCRAVQIGAWASVIVLLLAFARLDGSSATLYRGGQLLCALAVALVIAAVIREPRHVLGRALSWRPLVAVGLISYGLYLWHWPVYVYFDAGRLHLGGWPLLFGRLAITFALATISYVIVERPIRYRRGRSLVLRRATPVVAIALVIALVLSTSGATSVEGSGPRERWQLPDRTSEAWKQRLFRLEVAAQSGSSEPRVLVFGDSVVMTLNRAAPDVVYRTGGIQGAAWGALGCSIVDAPIVSGGTEREQDKFCRTWPDLLDDLVNSYRPDVVAIMLGPWEVLDRRIDGHKAKVGSERVDHALEDALERARKSTSRVKARMALLTTPCFAPTEPDSGGADTAWRDTKRIAALNDVWRRFAAKHPDDVEVDDFASMLCAGGRPLANVDDGEAVRPDGLHFSPRGAQLVWDWLARLPSVAAGGS